VQKLARRLPAIGFEHVDEPGRKSIGDLLRACQEKSFEPEGGFYELVARAMRVVQAVAAVDAELSRGFEKIPDPLGLEVLGQIEKKPGTAKEIAQALAPRDRPDRPLRRRRRDRGTRRGAQVTDDRTLAKLSELFARISDLESEVSDLRIALAEITERLEGGSK
jgi:hypothetical protein